MIEPTVTQNNALYFAQHKIPRERIPLGRRFMQGLRRRRQKVESKWPSGAVFIWPQVHR